MPLLYGQSKDFFKDANVTPDFIPTRGSDQALQLIESGQVDYAFIDCDTFLAAAAQKKTTTTAVYVWLDKPTLAIVSMTPLNGPKSLSGKSFGTLPQSTARTILPFVLKSNGVDPKTVDVQALDFSVLYALFLRGQFDTAEMHAPGSWQNVQEQAAAQGKKVYLTMLKDWGLVGYDKILVVRSALLHDSPGDVKRVVGAINRSLTQAIVHATDADASTLLQPVLPQAKPAALVGDWHDFKNLVSKPGPIDGRVFDDSLRRLKDVGIITDIPPSGTLYFNPR
jgi:ABC-type nitrate/sulfonate/bicarbonate transport system substrate-binding protein